LHLVVRPMATLAARHGGPQRGSIARCDAGMLSRGRTHDGTGGSMAAIGFDARDGDRGGGRLGQLQGRQWWLARLSGSDRRPHAVGSGSGSRRHHWDDNSAWRKRQPVIAQSPERRRRCGFSDSASSCCELVDDDLRGE
jgi:hypothetical protein